MPLIRLHDVQFNYQTPERRVEALRGVSLDIDPGEFIAVCGPSGCGKSTLLNIMGTLERPTSGQYVYDGHDLASRTPGQLAELRAQNIGFVFQSFNLIDSLSVYGNIELALLYRREREPNVRGRVMEAMDRVGIAHRANHLPGQLSGGQQQRCAIARAIVGRPAIILADEPTGNLDSENAAQIFGILKSLHHDGSTLVVVTHSPSQADQAQRVVEMLDGRIQFARRQPVMSLRLPILLHIARPLLKYWGVSLLNIVGYAIGFAAAVVIALYVRNELTFNHFIPNAEKVMVLTSVYSPANSPVVSNDKTPAGMAGWLGTDAPAVAAAARIFPVDWSMRSTRFQALEHFYWADPNLFDLLPVKAIAGDLRTALDKPYSVVLTRRMARRYFGRDDVVGQTLWINGASPITVTAVLADFPANNSLGREIFVSGLAAYSMLAEMTTHPDWQWASSYTFLRLKPGARLTPDEVRQVAARHWQNPYNLPAKFRLVPLSDLHFQPEADSQMGARGHRDTVTAMAAVAGLILVLAAINFAGLTMAQIDERSREMAVRRSLGARRHHLLLQVLVEAGVTTLLAILVGMALVERLLPVIDPLLGLQLSMWTAPGLVAGCALVAALTGLAGGLYPALALSATPTGQSGGNRRTGGRAYLSRVGWIAVQFTLLITLLISSQIVYRQWVFATGPALNFDTAHLLQISVYDGAGQDDAFRQHILALKGVKDAAYARFIPEQTDIRPGWARSPAGQLVQFDRQSVDTHFFHMFGVRLLAGRTFSDVYFANRPPDEVILSRSAAEALGYRRFADAVGRTLDYQGDRARLRATIVGVVEDMRVDTVRQALQPIVFDNQSFFFTRLNVKLTPDNEPGTLAAIDRTWKQLYPRANPIDRHFYADYLGELYGDMAQQGWAFGLLSIVGVCLSVLGLTGLSIYLARTRQGEIAIRNALGARLWDIFRLRLEPFVKPLIAANLAAGMLSWLLMSWWLGAFTAHIELSPLPFLNAGIVTVLITLATLTVHSLLTAPARSSQALRAG